MRFSRSQVQIASRTFNFVLPPPPPPEDTPSPSSQSSANRQRSPSLDITSISPPSSPASNFPPPPEELKPVILPPEPQVKLLSQPSAPLQPQLPNSNAIGKANKVNSKKRKKSDVNAPPPPPRPKPEDMPSKPPFTYAQLIYRAIKSIGGKATLQEICNWIMTTHEYYRYADGAWMVRATFFILLFELTRGCDTELSSPQSIIGSGFQENGTVWRG